MSELTQPDLSDIPSDDLCVLMFACVFSNDPSDKMFVKVCRDELAKRKISKPIQQPKDVQGVEPVARWNWNTSKLEWLVPYKPEYSMKPMYFQQPADQLSAAREEGRRQGLEEAAKHFCEIGHGKEMFVGEVEEEIRSLIK